jgi:hypothetical protein
MEAKMKSDPEPSQPLSRPSPGPAPASADALRQRIDHGETRDKVDFPDPAAAPLGTDAEAGGFPADAEELAMAQPAASTSGDQASHPAGSVADPRRVRNVLPVPYLVMAGIVLVVALVVVLAAQPAP